MTTQFSLENYTSTRLTDHSFIVWPARPNYGCALEEVKIRAEVRNGGLRAILTSATATMLRCHADILFANITLEKESERIASISFEGDKSAKTLKPYKALLVREVRDILQKHSDNDELAQGIIQRLTSIDLEIRELELSMQAYSDASSIPGEKEIFDIFVASHHKNHKSKIHLFAKYRLEIDILDEKVIAILSGERITKNGSFGDTIYANVVRTLLSKVALGIFREGYIEEPNIAGTTSFLEREGASIIKVVFNRG